uniref:Uncharacterized protein n=1 Tax=Romanomermis culicivorax TaxID=13658 RepID=A0A915IUC3_ROMCU
MRKLIKLGRKKRKEETMAVCGKQAGKADASAAMFCLISQIVLDSTNNIHAYKKKRTLTIQSQKDPTSNNWIFDHNLSNNANQALTSTPTKTQHIPAIEESDQKYQEEQDEQDKEPSSMLLSSSLQSIAQDLQGDDLACLLLFLQHRNNICDESMNNIINFVKLLLPNFMIKNIRQMKFASFQMKLFFPTIQRPGKLQQMNI